jgi:predicted dehydrogenase
MKIPVAVVGVGAFGKQHARVYRELAGAELVGVYDRDTGRARDVAREFGCRAFGSLEEAAGAARAASVAVPTIAHAGVGCELLDRGVDVLMEKPIAFSLADADRLVATARSGRRVLQVGHLERFNPAVVAARRVVTQPMFFEVHRLSVFTPRSLDVDVVLDLMIHDLDIVLALAGSRVEEVRAAGLPILSPKIDIANVRLSFENGCVANLTASRVSTERVRKLRFFQPRQYISVDYTRQDVWMFAVEGKPPAGLRITRRQLVGESGGDAAPGPATVFDMSEHAGGLPGMAELAARMGPLFDPGSAGGAGPGQPPPAPFPGHSHQGFASGSGPHPQPGAGPVVKEEPLRAQLRHFLECVEHRRTPLVAGEDGRRALELALQVVGACEEHLARLGLAGAAGAISAPPPHGSADQDTERR